MRVGIRSGARLMGWHPSYGGEPPDGHEVRNYIREYLERAGNTLGGEPPEDDNISGVGDGHCSKCFGLKYRVRGGVEVCRVCDGLAYWPVREEW